MLLLDYISNRHQSLSGNRSLNVGNPSRTPTLWHAEKKAPAHAQRRPHAETLHTCKGLHNSATRRPVHIVRSLGRPATMVRNGLIRRPCALWGRWVPLIGKARVLVLALAAVGVAGGWGRSGASAILALRERNLCDLHLLTRSRCGTLVVLRYMCGTD